MLTCALSKRIQLNLEGHKTEEEEDVHMSQENHKIRKNVNKNFKLLYN